MSGLAIIVFGTWLIISFVTFSPEYKSKVHHRYSEPRTETNWNAIALILNVYDYIIGVNWKKIFYPTTGIDREIAEEEKEIAELERQKEKIDTLAELKRRKERLFSDVHGTESWECKWCGSDDCLKPAYTVDGIAQYYCTSCHRWLNDGSSMV